MSSTIPSQAFAAGFNLKTYPIVTPTKKVSPDTGVNTNSTNADVQVDLSYLEVMKIIPEQGLNKYSNFSSDRSLANNKTAFSINVNSDELVVEIANPETGEDAS